MFHFEKQNLMTAVFVISGLASACSQSNTGSRTYADTAAESAPDGSEADVNKQGGEAPVVVTGTNLVFDFENFAATCAPGPGVKPTSARCMPANRQGRTLVIPDLYPAKFSFKWTVPESLTDAVSCKGLEGKDLDCDFVKPLSKPFSVVLEAYQLGVPSGHPQTSFPLAGTGTGGSQGGQGSGGPYLIVLSSAFSGVSFGPGGTGRQACSDMFVMSAIAHAWGDRDVTQLQSAPLLNFNADDSTSLSFRLMNNTGNIPDGPAHTLEKYENGTFGVEPIGASLREFWSPPAELQDGRRTLTRGVNYRWDKTTELDPPYVYTGFYSGNIEAELGSSNCSNWTDANSSSGGAGSIGDRSHSSWLSSTIAGCGTNLSIYCVFW